MQYEKQKLILFSRYKYKQHLKKYRASYRRFRKGQAKKTVNKEGQVIIDEGGLTEQKADDIV